MPEENIISVTGDSNNRGIVTLFLPSTDTY